MSTNIPAPRRRIRSCLVPVGVCLGLSAGIAGLLCVGVRKAQDSARMSQLT